jgi:chromosome segregation ATPase
MFKDIKKKFTTKAILYFALVVILLIITVDQKNKINILQAEVDGLINIGEATENQYLVNITTLESAITSYESELKALQGRIIQVDGDRVKAEIEIERVKNQLEACGLELNANTTALNEALENPNCSQ